MLDYEALIAPFDGEGPCGPDLRGDPEFRDIEDAPGDFANQKAPELMAVVNRCDAFLQRTKDQAPALVAVQAAVRIGDFALANAALALVKGYAEDYWDDFHPGPAEEMAVARINELSALARPAAMTLPLQRAFLARMPVPSTQGFTAAMVSQACEPTGEWTSEDESALASQLESGQVNATYARTVRPNREGARTLRTIVRILSPAARSADADAGVDADDIGMGGDAQRALALDLRGQIATARAQLQEMSDTLYDINAIYDTRVGDSATLGPVLQLLRAVVEDCDRFLAIFPEEEEAQAGDADAVDADGAADGAGGGGTVRAKGFVVTTPQTRDDAVAALDAVVRFFEEREPTSPVPLMIKRVRAWVRMDFMELLNEIAPDAIMDAQKLLAVPEESSIEY